MEKTKKKIVIALAIGAIACLGTVSGVLGRENVNDWYIKSFDQEMKVNYDSSILVTENIVADCGQATGKHGIFRVLPTITKTPDKTIKTPIQLISITDFSGKPIKYAAINNKADNTITWKIGDPNIDVHGINEYEIVYLVKNALLFDNTNFDEFYRNLNGNFWTISTDSFKSRIIFPKEITKENAQIDYYTGSYGEAGKGLATYQWVSDNVLEFNATDTLVPGEGITASVAFPKNIFTQYKLSFWEKYGDRFKYLYFLIPIILFIYCFRLWVKYGKDINLHRVTTPEFEIPFNLNPIEMGVFLANGGLGQTVIPAGIINLAVSKIIAIEQVEQKSVFKTKDWKFKLLISREQIEALDLPNKLLVNELFKNGSKGEVIISELKDFKFREKTSQIKDQLVSDGFLDKKGFSIQGGLMGLFILFSIVFFIAIQASIANWQFAVSIFGAGAVALIFSILMPKRTQKGAELAWKIKGFQMYMKVAEKYRQQFNEKENIFEKFLPYAILFNMTSLWINKMKTIYGQEYMDNYHPIWFVALGGFNSSDFNSFASSLNSISHSISSSVGSGSGFSGGGFSGGGGGGGGGGGW